MNRLITKEITSKTSQQISSGPDGFTGEFCQIFKEEILQCTQTFTSVSMSKLTILYTLKICDCLYVNYISINCFKNTQLLFLPYFTVLSVFLLQSINSCFSKKSTQLMERRQIEGDRPGRGQSREVAKIKEKKQIE